MHISRPRSAKLAQLLTIGSLFITSARLGLTQAPPPIVSPPQVVTAENAAAPPADSNRISIDVVVSDKLGHPTGGLKASDFTLLDNKAPQKLLSFRALDVEAPHSDPVSVLVVLDTINADFSTVARERQELSHFLKQDGGELAIPTSVAIFADGGAKMQQGFSRDGNALDAVLSRQQVGLRTVTRSTGFWGAAERLEMSLQS